MALKRINKELTDLGRYVQLIFPETITFGGGGWRRGSEKPFKPSLSTTRNQVLTLLLTVTRRLHALQDLLEMIWYVFCPVLAHPCRWFLF